MVVQFEVLTLIEAPRRDVFDASLSIDAHLGSMSSSGEKAIAGVTSGQIGLGETVTWRAKHWGITWTMTSKITDLDEPELFVDQQVRGPFKTFRHEHVFIDRTADDKADRKPQTEMTDRIRFRAPLGPLGLIAEKLVLGWYLPKLIRQRNAYLKASLES